ncbi:hypothetical protein FMEXI_10626 [Fusarium mexicanum]|uniref:Uncharacterized protein n=1 Tax=Fusarium mexicanum TaxID=751941 RepID=A0A8H5MMT5_9HYPO|nr:hypothetical protein FMEXI_10626 [Fusarium mexicanum]
MADGTRFVSGKDENCLPVLQKPSETMHQSARCSHPLQTLISPKVTSQYLRTTQKSVVDHVASRDSHHAVWYSVPLSGKWK